MKVVFSIRLNFHSNFTPFPPNRYYVTKSTSCFNHSSHFDLRATCTYNFHKPKPNIIIISLQLSIVFELSNTLWQNVIDLSHKKQQQFVDLKGDYTQKAISTNIYTHCVNICIRKRKLK